MRPFILVSCTGPQSSSGSVMCMNVSASHESTAGRVPTSVRNCMALRTDLRVHERVLRGRGVVREARLHRRL